MWILNGLYNLRNEEKTAIITRNGNYSFKEVWDKSECIAADIESTGKKTPVVIYGDKEKDIFPTLIAILKTGRAYVPVDVSYPVERLKYIADMVDACLIYNYSDVNLDLEFEVRTIADVYERVYAMELEGEMPHEKWVKDDDICYILFTSGSTGKPKGVPIYKRNIENFNSFDLLDCADAGDNALLQPSISFDAFGQPFYRYFAAGKTLVATDKGLMGDIPSMIKYISDNNVNIWVSTPSLLNMCLNHSNFNSANWPSLQKVYLGGEIFTNSTATMMKNRFPNVRLFNLYGPTEATICVSGCEITTEMLKEDGPFSIGDFLDEVDIQILRDDGSECGEDEKGELVVISKSVTTGYVNNPQKTQESFFKSKDGRMGYRTGDLVLKNNGRIYFQGRKDFQIKLNGYRIELEDVEENLCKIPFVSQGAVLPSYTPDGNVEFLVGVCSIRPDYPEKNHLKNSLEIRKEMKQLVPAYMIPQKIMIMDELPHNVNGKVDHKALETMI